MSGGVMVFHAYPHQYAGAQRMVDLLTQGLRGRGIRTWVTTPGRGPFTERLAAAGTETRPVVAPLLWRRYGRALEGPLAAPALATLPGYWVKLALAIRRWQPAVVHVNDHRGILLAGPAARLAGVPIVWHLHGEYYLPPLTRLGGRLADRILVVSRFTSEAMGALREFDDKITIFPNGIPPFEVTDEDVRERSAIRRNGRRSVVTGARINPDKGLDVLLRAAARVTARHDDVDFYVAGHVQDGYEEHYQDLLRLRDELGLGERFAFLGAVDAPPTWAAADVYCQPSRVEPFGLGVLESWSLRKPVVVSNVGGLAEIVADDRYGVRVPPEDPDALADGLEAVLSDAARATELADAGHARMHEVFSVDGMLDRLLAQYAGIGVTP